MAGDWIKMRCNLWDDPRVSNLCDATGAAEATVVGGLYWLWATADQHSADGLLPGMTVKTLDRKCGVPGLGAALVQVGWLEETQDGLWILNFSDHNGASAKSRAQTARRVANYKATNGEVTQTALPKDDDSVSGALPREEKRREEGKPTTPDGVVATGAAGGDVIQLPTKSKPDCPHQAIIDLYHEVLPMCPRIREWTPARATQLRARWNEDQKRQNLDYWRRFFEYVASCDFLVGRGGKSPFFADLEWICKAKNFTKIREQRYENRGAA